jgi:pyrroline-5-carboxylate reductase
VTIAVLGGGAMGEALVAGLLTAGRSRSDVVVGEKRAERAAELTDRYGIDVVSNLDAVRRAGVVVLVVKPNDVVGLADEIAPELTTQHLVISVAAGITTSTVEEHVPAGVPVVRAMPNTPALVGEGMAAVSAGTAATDEHLATAVDLLGATGRVVTVPEYHQDAVTAVSGSGPAYVFYLAEAMIEAGVHVGLPRDVATDLAVQTIYGAATLLRDGDASATELRERVTSPAGTTAAGLRALDDAAVRAAVIAAVEAARDRSRQLSGN